MRAISLARQKEIRSDVNKMVKLTTELHEEIARANSDSLTAAQLRKLGQIEKLAHDIKLKMSELMMPGLQPFEVRE